MFGYPPQRLRGEETRMEGAPPPETLPALSVRARPVPLSPTLKCDGGNDAAAAAAVAVVALSPPSSLLCGAWVPGRVAVVAAVVVVVLGVARRIDGKAQLCIG